MADSCDAIGLDLTLSNTFGVDNPRLTLLTPLISECQALDPLARFNQYCLLPTAEGYGSSCDVTQRPESDFIFLQMQSGAIDTLEELPLLWSSAPAVVASEDEWVSGIIADSLDFMTTTGARALKVSNGATDLIAWSSEDDHGYMAAEDGLWYPVPLPETVLFYDMTSFGELRVMGDSTSYFWWYQGAWSQGPEIQGTTIMAIRLWSAASFTTNLMAIVSRDSSNMYIDVYQSTSGTFTNPTLRLSTTLSPPLTVTSYEYAAIALDNASDHLNFFIFAISLDGLQVWMTHTNYTGPISSWEKTIDLDMLVATTVDVIVSVSMRGTIETGADPYEMFMFIPTKGMIDYTIPKNEVDPPVFNRHETSVRWGISTSLNNQFQCYIRRQDVPLLFVVNNGVESEIRPANPSFLGDPDRVWSFGVDPGGTILCLSYDDNIYTNLPTATDGTAWSTANSFTIFNPTKVSDIGTPLLNTAQYNPGPQWFMGVFENVASIPNWGETVTSATYESFHHRYRVVSTVETGIMSGLPASTPNVTSAQLQRSNEVAMIQNLSHETRIYNDGNVRVLDSDLKTVIWENNMHDGIGTITNYNVVNRTRPTASPNGLYMAYWGSDGTFRVCLYAWNSFQFRDYGITSDTIFANSLLSQSNFCYANLQIEPDNPLNIKFSDDRCTCIGGQVLFERVFTNTDLLPPAQKSLLLGTYACMMVDCTKTRITFEPSNTFRKMDGQCVFPITICSNIIRASGSAAIGTVNINQNCGGTGITCSSNSDCAIGMACSGGQCYQTCNEASDCKTVSGVVFDCVAGLCSMPSAGGSSAGLSAGAIAGIAVAAVIVVAGIAVLLWYFLSYRPAMLAKKAGGAKT